MAGSARAVWAWRSLPHCQCVWVALSVPGLPSGCFLMYGAYSARDGLGTRSGGAGGAASHAGKLWQDAIKVWPCQTNKAPDGCEVSVVRGRLWRQTKQANSTLPVHCLLAARCSLVFLLMLVVDRDLGSLSTLERPGRCEYGDPVCCAREVFQGKSKNR